mgnify:CR=1 FL=1
MLNIFDSYSRESQDLLHSMKESGFDHPTVVLEPNGFLPDGVEYRGARGCGNGDQDYRSNSEGPEDHVTGIVH